VKEKNGIYILGTNNNGRNVQESLHSVYQGSTISNGELWHRRMGDEWNLNYSYLNNLKDLVTGLHFEKTDYQPSCMPCLEDKKIILKNRREQIEPDVLELVHSDVCGPMQMPSWGGAQ